MSERRVNRKTATNRDIVRSFVRWSGARSAEVGMDGDGGKRIEDSKIERIRTGTVY